MFSSVSFTNSKKLKGQFLMRAKRTMKKFEKIKVYLPMKFMSLSCTMVTILYMSTPQGHGDRVLSQRL